MLKDYQKEMDRQTGKNRKRETGNKPVRTQ